MRDPPEGEAVACAMPMPDHLDDPDLQEAMQKQENLDKIPLRCVQISRRTRSS